HPARPLAAEPLRELALDADQDTGFELEKDVEIRRVSGKTGRQLPLEAQRRAQRLAKAERLKQRRAVSIGPVVEDIDGEHCGGMERLHLGRRVGPVLQLRAAAFLEVCEGGGGQWAEEVVRDVGEVTACVRFETLRVRP